MDYLEEQEKIIPTLEEFIAMLENFIEKANSKDFSYEKLEEQILELTELIDKMGVEHPNIKPRELKKIMIELDNQLLYIDAHVNKEISLNSKVYEKKDMLIEEFNKLIKGLNLKSEN